MKSKTLACFVKFQIRLALLLNLTIIPAGLAVVTFAFTAFKPNYRCSIPQCDESASHQTVLGDIGYKLSSKFLQGSEIYSINGTLPEYVRHIFNNNTEELSKKSCQLPVIIQEEESSPCDTFVEQFLASNQTFERWDNYLF